MELSRFFSGGTGGVSSGGVVSIKSSRFKFKALAMASAYGLSTSFLAKNRFTVASETLDAVAISGYVQSLPSWFVLLALAFLSWFFPSSLTRTVSRLRFGLIFKN
ncbi:hypothetical protein SR1949_29970 [Sphaerospermopsis reniformis]|uniref:Uncharacterized protein n=1 Tax=Sphaerospermopsis reniformis TaxID=531300 RepID=A0A479ZYY5_9CYAN|nr:hypothetical protein SR1949_29970 [Sphaerospermopsis reniformis]